MMFRHVSGARATQIDVVAVGAHRELIIGRASSAAVRLDARRDANVGRHHARISWTGADPTRPALADLGSRNGTFVNGTRVIGTVTLKRGDVIRLGATGPEIQFDWELDSTLGAPDDVIELPPALGGQRELGPSEAL